MSLCLSSLSACLLVSHLDFLAVNFKPLHPCTLHLCTFESLHLCTFVPLQLCTFALCTFAHLHFGKVVVVGGGVWCRVVGVSGW